MRRTLLILTVSVPVTYDDAAMSETEALDAMQGVVEAAVARAVEGRHIATDGTYLDYHGPAAVDVCQICHGRRATPTDLQRSQDVTLPDEEQPWERALCWVGQYGPHMRASKTPRSEDR